MRNLIAKTSLLIAFLVLFAGKVNAAVLDSQFIMEKVKKSVEEKVKPMVKGEVLIESSGIRTKIS
ncbi:MAG: hypothetical protein MZV64_27005 [Ignavibacteriales bacterium]|nr:hypothetical protein [Ignavibacteriales bacterium]